MKEFDYSKFMFNLEKRLKVRKPLSGQIELTYRCNYDCIHCYCKGIEKQHKELNTAEWKDILNQVYDEGCIELCFTGGDPLIRNDFLDIYSYAKKKGFLISIFTNASLFNSDIIDYLVKYPPYLIEVTLNGITKSCYENITQAKGSFNKTISAIMALASQKLPLILKANGLRQNKKDILKIKSFSEKLLGRGKFKFDYLIFPRLNGSKTPCKYRLSPEEISKIVESDKDMLIQKENGLHRTGKATGMEDYLYLCTSWRHNFFINPYGRLKFCHLTEKFSSDLKKVSFKEGFYRVFPRVSQEKFRTNSFCRHCGIRAFCFNCPARAYLEVKNEEASVQYYCKLAKQWKGEKI